MIIAVETEMVIPARAGHGQRYNMQGVSIIIPTRNEADNIDHLLQRIFDVDFLQSIEHEVIFVDDSSTDLTRENIRKWCADKPVHLVERNTGSGLASAVVAGALQARYNVSLIMDADLSHPPEKIPEIVVPLLSGDYDMVIGSRYVEGGEIPEWPLARKIASKLATIPARLFTDVNDPMAGFFGTTTDRLISLRPDVPGFKIGLEVLAVGGDELRVLEVPIIFNDRFEGFSKMNKRVIFEYLKQVVQLGRYRVDVFTPSRLLLLLIIGTICNIAVFSGVLQTGSDTLNAHLAGATASVLLLALIMNWMHSRGTGKRSSVLRQLTGLPIIYIYTLSLQGGVFYLFDKLKFLPTIAAFIPGAVVSSGCFVLIGSIFLFSGFSGLPKRVQAKLAVISTVVALVLLRLVYLGLPELMEQEAYYWNYAQHPSLSYLDHPPMVALLIGLGGIVFGITEFAVRIGAFCCWFVTAFFSYRLTADILGRTAAWGSVLLVSILPLYFGTGFVITPDSPLHAAWAAFIYFLYRSVVVGHSKAWIGVGISLGIGMLSKYTIVLLGPGVLLFLLVDKRARTWFFKPQPYAALLIAILLFAPVLIWNYQHDWGSFLFQGEQRVTGQTFFTTHRLLAYMTMLLTPAGLLGVIWFLLRGNNFVKMNVLPTAGREIGFFSRDYLFLLFLVLSPLAVFFVFSLSKEVKMNWTSPVWLAALPFLGYSVMACGVAVHSRFLRFLHWFWKISAVSLTIGYCLFFHYATLGLPGIPFYSDPFLLGWEGLAEEVEAVADTVEDYTGNRPVIVGMDPYQINSGLAFYRAKINRNDQVKRKAAVAETLGWHLFGWKGLMYEYWAHPEDYYGRDVVAIASSEIRVEYPYFQQRFLLLNKIHPIDVEKNGQLIHRYYYRVVRKYREARK